MFDSLIGENKLSQIDRQHGITAVLFLSNTFGRPFTPNEANAEWDSYSLTEQEAIMKHYWSYN